MVYKVVDNYEGKDKLFEDKKDAKIYKRERKAEIHLTYCVDKKVPTKCLCTSSGGSEECGAHEYARTIVQHSVVNCGLVIGNVYIEEIEIN